MNTPVKPDTCPPTSTTASAAGSTRPRGLLGVEIAGVGSALPQRTVTNEDLAKVMDTSDEWIVQRTGIKSRRRHDPALGESTAMLAAEATRAALADAGLSPDDLDLIITGTMTPDTPTPSVGCMVASRLGCRTIGAMDVNAACSGFVYCLNIAHDLITLGRHRNIAVIGADCVTRHCDFSTFGRSVSVLFGDGAGAVVLRATKDSSKGILAQAMHSDGSGAKHLYIPSCLADFADPSQAEERKINYVQMNGPAVFKFAVGTFPGLIEETLDLAGLAATDIDHFVCHQSNQRILQAASDRFGITPDKLRVNIDRYGNTVGASVPLILAELKAESLVKPGQKVMFLAFGAGLTWASSLWQL